MKTFPESKKARRELFNILGIQGGTCHQLPNIIRETKRYKRKVSFKINDNIIGSINKYGLVSLYNIREFDEAFGAPMVNLINISSNLEKWFVCYMNGIFERFDNLGDSIYRFK